MTAPIRPGKIVAVGKNYLDHVREMGGDAPSEEPILFMKPPSAVIAHGEAILLPPQSERVDYEGELVAVIGERLRNVDAAAALRGVQGYTCGNDVTARDLQAKDGQWTRAKGFDSFCPIGPWIETDLPALGLDPADLEVACTVDGELRQSGRTSQLIFDVPTLISYISQVMTLLPGDVVLTGTPSGVGPIAPGQRVDVTIEGLGTLTNSVSAAEGVSTAGGAR
jgi:2-keto-4-pentenoate hydratase/2-oxohepta-3-ene-1,7-dioic acid hydratase in catechol pathway